MFSVTISVRTVKHRPMSAKMHNWLRVVANNYMKVQIGVRF
jgi:hypothetical protein